MKNLQIVVFCLASMLMSPALVRGADAGAENWKRIQTLQQEGAFGGESDKNQYTLDIRKQVRTFLWTTNTLTFAEAAEFSGKLTADIHTNALQRVGELAANTALRSAPFRPALDRAWQQVLEELIRTQSNLTARIETNDYQKCWTINTLNFRTLSGESLLIGDLITTIADSGASADAVKAGLLETESIITIVELTRRALIPVIQAKLGSFAEKASRTDKQWEKYFDVMKPETWWETAINSGSYTYFDNPDDAGRFNRPPVSQWTFLHPSAGYEVSGFGSDDLAPTLLVEFLGYNRLSWNKDKEISDWPVGISLAGCYTLGETDVNRWGLGVMVNIKSYYGLGAFVRDPGGEDEFAAVMNFDLVSFFQEKIKASKKVLKYVGVKAE